MSVRSTPGSWRTLTALCLLLLSACSTPPVVTPTVDPAPANLTAECPPPPQLPKRQILVGELVEADAELALQYRECAARHRGLADWARGIARKRVP